MMHDVSNDRNQPKVRSSFLPRAMQLVDMSAFNHPAADVNDEESAPFLRRAGGDSKVNGDSSSDDTVSLSPIGGVVSPVVSSGRRCGLACPVRLRLTVRSVCGLLHS